MADLGRAALVTRSCFSSTPRGGFLLRGSRRRRLADSAQNAYFAAFARHGSRLRRAPRGARPARLLVPVRRRPHEPGASARLHADGVLGRAGRVAAVVAARSLRLFRRSRADLAPSAARGARLGRPDARSRRNASSPYCSFSSPARSRHRPRSPMGRASTRACRTHTWRSIRRCSTSATSA